MKDLLFKFNDSRCDKCPSYYEYSKYDDKGYGCILIKDFEGDTVCKYAFLPRCAISIILKIRDWNIDRILKKQ